ncbi:MAG: RNA 2',3'-cyclic phosphodiesterase [Methanolinea sp.]|nr:RNA 2',3'-cyclic phosphodiesterase [Methanolinea sp.]
MVRLFVAVDLPDEVREGIRQSQTEIAKCRARLTLVDPGIIHLTLKFIGEVPEERVPLICNALRTIRREPFLVRARGVAGNNPRQPRVIWCRLEDKGELAGLSAEIEGALAPLGIPREERAFRPHATLARVKEFHRSLTEQIGSLSETEFGSFTVNGFTLKRSTLTPRGPVYENLMEVSF